MFLLLTLWWVYWCVFLAFACYHFSKYYLTVYTSNKNREVKSRICTQRLRDTCRVRHQKVANVFNLLSRSATNPRPTCKVDVSLAGLVSDEHPQWNRQERCPWQAIFKAHQSAVQFRVNKNFQSMIFFGFLRVERKRFGRDSNVIDLKLKWIVWFIYNRLARRRSSSSSLVMSAASSVAVRCLFCCRFFESVYLHSASSSGNSGYKLWNLVQCNPTLNEKMLGVAHSTVWVLQKKQQMNPSYVRLPVSQKRLDGQIDHQTRDVSKHQKNVKNRHVWNRHKEKNQKSHETWQLLSQEHQICVIVFW